LFQFAIVSPAVPLNSETYLGYSNYQIITDETFPVDRYFRLMEKHGVNLQRIWITGYSNAAPDVEELMPFVFRRGRYDLFRINPAYKKRLSEVLEQAGAHNQRVMLTLFDHWALSRKFGKTPWYIRNNHQNILHNSLPDFYDLRNKKLMRIQENLVREIVRSSRRYHPIYEIMNEAGSQECEPIAAWHEQVAEWILEEFPDAEIAVNLKRECREVLDAEWVDFISFHQGVWEETGICGVIEKYPEKHVIIDTDGAWEYRDDNKLVKTWLNESLDCGASFNHKDDIYEPDRELLEIYKRVRKN
jgi:hypothetical protein